MRYVDVGEDDKRDTIAAVFVPLGQQVANKTYEAGSTEAFSVERQ